MQKSMIYKNCIKAYSELECLEPNRQIKLFFFDQSMDSLNKALYFGI